MTELREKLEKIYKEETSVTKGPITLGKEWILHMMELAVSTLQLDRGKELPNNEEINAAAYSFYNENFGKEMSKQSIFKAGVNWVTESLSLLPNREETKPETDEIILSLTQDCDKKDLEITSLKQQLEEANKAEKNLLSYLEIHLNDALNANDVEECDGILNEALIDIKEHKLTLNTNSNGE